MARKTLWMIVFMISSLVLVPLFLQGCFGGPPAWVKKGSGAFQSDTKAFYGVGAIKGIHNPPLATNAADNRARAELGKILETYSASLIRDYAASSVVGDFAESTEEQLIEQALKTFSATTLSGVQIVNHWTDKDEDITYSLAKLDLDDFEAQIERVKAFNGEVREYLRKNAVRLFDHLGAEESERNQ
ncbi:MAG: hypothetical protein CMH81_00280 [Nitrospiraceae bacterium]|nr:hypothetical protein [Nitrospiraceae bacterium]|tara:strand:- start:483 stop:1043 length:561 start_codon:yes stop_codon:yes gene_type:complete